MSLPKEKRYSLANALTWDEQEHIELIEGAPVMMAPPSRIHQEVATELTRQIGNYLDGKSAGSTLLPSLSGSLRRPTIDRRTWTLW